MIQDAGKIKNILPQGYRWFDILSVEGSSSSISFSNNRLHTINERQSSGLGIRINASKRTGFSFTNDKDNLHEAAKRAVSFIPYGDIEDFELPASPVEIHEPYNEHIKNYSTAEEILKGESIISAIRATYDDANVSVSIGKSEGSTELMNSVGFFGQYRNSLYSLSVSVNRLKKNGAKIDLWDSLSATAPKDAGDISKRLIRYMRMAETERKTESGELPVIFTPRAFAKLVGIVLSGLNGRAIYKGISPYIGKMNKKIFNEKLTITDDPTKIDSPYSYPFDDEGITGRKKNIIENGIPTCCIADLKYASLLKIEASGNASRGYSSLPSASFAALDINAGETNISDIFKTFKRGIFACQFIGLGQSNTLSGDFSANLDLGYLFENGEITGRVKDCMIAGNIFTLLENEFLLSSEREQTGGSLTPYCMFPKIRFISKNQ